MTLRFPLSSAHHVVLSLLLLSDVVSADRNGTARTFLSRSPIAADRDGTGEATKLMLDDMEDYFNKDKTFVVSFPHAYYEKIVNCFGQFDNPRVLEAQDAGWRKFFEHYLEFNNRWDKFPDEDKFIEYFIEDQDKIFGDRAGIGSNRRYEVLEPCNYVSNVANYGSTIRICDANWRTFNQSSVATIMRSFATVALASFWFHGSMTDSGSRWDGAAIIITINVAYQLIVSSIESDSTVFKAGHDDFPQVPIDELVDPLLYMPLNDSLPVNSWFGYINSLPIPTSLVEGPIITFYFGCAVSVPLLICNGILSLVAPAFASEEENDFFFNVYAPEVAKVVQDEGFPIPFWRGWPLLCKGLSVILGFAISLAYQEQTIELPFLTENAFSRFVGAALDPLITGFTRLFHGYPNTDKKGYNGNKDAYPGAKECNRKSAHALWHQRAANSLFEVFAYADEVNQEIIHFQNSKKRQTK